jgi:hypothetical protein
MTTVTPAESPSIHDATFKTILYDVVIRFHEHNLYKSETTALKALSRRYPGLTLAEYQSSFNLYSHIHKATIQYLPTILEIRPCKMQGKISSNAGLDTSLILKQLQAQFPNESSSVFQKFISWVIFWHYLK